MLIDWFTVIAQVLNFAILAWLMKRFLYKPILDAIDAREKRIADELAAAKRKKLEAQHERDDLHQKNEDFEHQRAALLEQARSDAEAERRKLMDDAHLAAEALTGKRQAALASAAKTLTQTLRQRAQAEVFAIARQALTELTDTSLEARACGQFLAKLKTMDPPTQDKLAAALQAAQHRAVVRSAFDLPSTLQQTIREGLAQCLGTECELTFQTKPEQIAGIELVANGQKFAWSLGAQLDALERGAADWLQAHDPSSHKSGRTSDTKAPRTAHADGT